MRYDEYVGLEMEITGCASIPLPDPPIDRSQIVGLVTSADLFPGARVREYSPSTGEIVDYIVLTAPFLVADPLPKLQNVWWVRAQFWYPSGYLSDREHALQSLGVVPQRHNGEFTPYRYCVKNYDVPIPR